MLFSVLVPLVEEVLIENTICDEQKQSSTEIFDEVIQFI
jgi:hypothetical protein